MTPRHPLDVLTPARKNLGREGKLRLLERETATAVDEAVAARWAEWAERHPRVARQLGRRELVDLAVAELMDDEAYHKAMHRAALVSEAAGVMAKWARWSANRWLRL